MNLMREQLVVKNSIEKSANYEGNETLLLQERLQNPEIQKQLVNTYYQFYRERDIENHLTEAEIIDNLKKDIEKVFLSTEVDLSKEGINNSGSGNSETGTINIYSLNPETKERWTNKQLSITEAHEKGHIVRSFQHPGKIFEQKIQSGFDFTKSLNPEIGKKIEEIKIQNITQEVKEQKLKEYFMFPMEIIERMSQLKNYFGMRGAELFTKEHLEYARKNYISDTGTPLLQMQPFFDAITPQTEKKFLELINTIGI